jgi:hypothetical protein
VKATCLLKLRRGDPPAIFQSRVELLAPAARIYNAFHEIDRTEMGELEFVSMLAVLDEYGWTEKIERSEVRSLWRAMRAEERRIWEEKRKLKKDGTQDAEEDEE